MRVCAHVYACACACDFDLLLLVCLYAVASFNALHFSYARTSVLLPLQAVICGVLSAEALSTAHLASSYCCAADSTASPGHMKQVREYVSTKWATTRTCDQVFLNLRCDRCIVYFVNMCSFIHHKHPPQQATACCDSIRCSYIAYGSEVLIFIHVHARRCRC